METNNENLIIKSIIEKEKNGTTCSEEESAVVKQWIKNNCIQPAKEEYEMLSDIKNILPIEYGEALSEVFYKVGTKVKVVRPIDETCLQEQIGKTGEVTSLNTNGETGNDEDYPLFIVKFDDGTGEDGFWYEELEEIIYTPENVNPETSDDKHYTKSDFLKIAKGNKEYAQNLIDRCTWEHPETLVEEDLCEGEIIEKEGTYQLTQLK